MIKELNSLRNYVSLHRLRFLYAELVEKTLSSKAYDYTQQYLIDTLDNKLSKDTKQRIIYANQNCNTEELFEGVIHSMNNALRINEAKCTQAFTWRNWLRYQDTSNIDFGFNYQGKKIDIFINGKYEASTNWARSCKEAKIRYVTKHIDDLESSDIVKCFYDKDRK